jgi:uncharacterized Fe-S cluster protein YjdI
LAKQGWSNGELEEEVGEAGMSKFINNACGHAWDCVKGLPYLMDPVGSDIWERL